MTLIEFLLARIADDEVAARDAIAERERVQFVDGAPEGRPGYRDLVFISYPDSSVPAVLVGPERVLLDCDLKRFIVSQYCEIESTRGSDSMSRYSRTLQAMAAVYEHHPEFDSTWITNRNSAPPF